MHKMADKLYSRLQQVRFLAKRATTHTLTHCTQQPVRVQGHLHTTKFALTVCLHSVCVCVCLCMSVCVCLFRSLTCTSPSC